uniref:Uncharacterized protein n=1 Tax=Arundo donax TaxID=35708 RepID=A0A0A9CWH9_ARUDO
MVCKQCNSLNSSWIQQFYNLHFHCREICQTEKETTHLPHKRDKNRMNPNMLQ